MHVGVHRRHLPVLLAAIGLLLAPARAAVPADEPISIPVVISLTGGAAFLGKDEAQSLQILERLVNENGGIKGRPIHFAMQDDQSNPQVGLQLTNAILTSHPPLILGSDIISICNAMYPVTKDRVVQYCFSPGAHPDPGSYLFSGGVGSREIYGSLLHYFKVHGISRLGAIWSTDATGQDGEQNIDAMLALPENKGMQIVANEHFNATDLSVTAQMSHLVAANAQVCLCWTTGAAFGTLLRAYTEAGVSFPVATSTGNMTFAQMTQYASLNNKELYFVGFPYFGREQLKPGPLKSAIDAFYRAYDSAGAKPDSAAGDVWDAGLITVAAYRALGADATAPQIHDYIEHLRGFPGIDGIYDFVANPQRGTGQNSAVMTKWDQAKGTWVMVQ